MKKILKQAIFDLDGCLINTEELRYQAWKKAINNKGYSFTYEDNNKLLGRHVPDINEIFTRMFPKVDITELRNDYNIIQDELLKIEGVDVKPGVNELLEILKSKGIKTVLATSSYEALALRTFEGAKFKHKFDYCIYGDQVEKSKPDPEIYIKASNLFGIDKENILIFEDSLSGIIAANRAGIDVVFIPDIGVFPLEEISIFQKINKIDDILDHIQFIE